MVVDNPYKGLRAFGEADSLDFFGRERVVERLLNRIGERASRGRLVALVGPSGSGKSSVVRAGMIPALRSGALPGSADWFVTDMRASVADGLFRLDASDAMPPEIGLPSVRAERGAFLLGMADFVNEGPGNLEEVLRRIDEAWPS